MQIVAKSTLISLEDIRERWSLQPYKDRGGLERDPLPAFLWENNLTIFIKTGRERIAEDGSLVVPVKYVCARLCSDVRAFSNLLQSIRERRDPAYLEKVEVEEIEMEIPHLLSPVKEDEYSTTPPAPVRPRALCPFAEPDAGAAADEETDELGEQLAAAKAEVERLKTENAALSSTVQKVTGVYVHLRRELDTAKEELAQVRTAQAQAERADAGEQQLSLPRYGMIAFVDDCYLRGMTVKQVAEALQKKGLSKPQIAVLLHTSEEKKADWGQIVDRILNEETIKLAWTVPRQVVGKKIPGG